MTIEGKKGCGRSVYIAGPMAGVEDLNSPAFARAAEKLSAEGWTVYDPVEIGEMYGTADEIQSDPELLAKVVKAELGFVARADAIYLLEGWEKSVGAKRELLVALGCGLEVILAEHRSAIRTDDADGQNAKADSQDKGHAGHRCATKQVAELTATTKENNK